MKLSGNLWVVAGMVVILTGSQAAAENWCTNVPSAAASGIAVGNVVAGQTYTYTATGCAANNADSGANSSSANPDGNVSRDYCDTFTSNYVYYADFKCPGLTAYSLVGKINGDPCIQLGSSGSFTPSVSGGLALYFNDGNYGDNSGGWDVCLSPAPTQLVNQACVTVPANAAQGVAFGPVVAGQAYQYTAAGCAANNADSGENSSSADPDGNVSRDFCTTFTSNYVYHTDIKCPGLIAYSLVGQINGGPCIQLGSSGSFTPTVSGNLVLFMNDGFYGDNSGGWEVCLEAGPADPSCILQELIQQVAALELTPVRKGALLRKLSLRDFIKSVKSLERNGVLDHATAESLSECAEQLSPGSTEGH